MSYICMALRGTHTRDANDCTLTHIHLFLSVLSVETNTITVTLPNVFLGEAEYPLYGRRSSSAFASYVAI